MWNSSFRECSWKTVRRALLSLHSFYALDYLLVLFYWSVRLFPHGYFDHSSHLFFLIKRTWSEEIFEWRRKVVNESWERRLVALSFVVSGRVGIFELCETKWNRKKDNEWEREKERKASIKEKWFLPLTVAFFPSLRKRERERKGNKAPVIASFFFNKRRHAHSSIKLTRHSFLLANDLSLLNY